SRLIAAFGGGGLAGSAIGGPVRRARRWAFRILDFGFWILDWEGELPGFHRGNSGLSRSWNWGQGGQWTSVKPQGWAGQERRRRGGGGPPWARLSADQVLYGWLTRSWKG